MQELQHQKRRKHREEKKEKKKNRKRVQKSADSGAFSSITMSDLVWLYSLWRAWHEEKRNSDIDSEKR